MMRIPHVLGALAMAAFFTPSAFAHWRMDTGINFSWLGLEDTADVKTYSYAAPHFGLYYEVPWTGGFSFLPGLLLEEKGEKIGESAANYIKLSYIQLPILIGHRSTGRNGVAVLFTAGPEAGLRWKSRLQGVFREYEANRDIRRFDFGAACGTTLEFPGAQAGLLLGLSYYHGLMEILPGENRFANKNLKVTFGIKI
jgi:hypothetical protein